MRLDRSRTGRARRDGSAERGESSGETPSSRRSTSCSRCSSKRAASAPILQKAGADGARSRRARRKIESLPRVSGGAEPSLSRRCQAADADLEAVQGVQGRVRLDRAPAARAARRARHEPPSCSRSAGVDKKTLLEGARRGARHPARHRSRTPRASTRRSRSTRATSPSWRASGKLDPVIGRDEEIRRVDAGAVAPHQEQPGADRRARRRQDRDRRGHRAAHRRRRRARVAQGQARPRARPRRAWSPAPSSAASSRTA